MQIPNVKSRFVGCAFLIAAALSGCGGANTSDPVSACKSAVAAVCDKSFQCYPAGAQQVYGTLSDCNSKLAAQICSPAMTSCPAGTTFNPDAAGRCVDGYRNESCSDLLNSVIPTSCNQNCN